MGVVCFFPTTLGINPIQVSKHHNILTIPWIQFNTSTKSIHIYTNALVCLTVVIGNVHIGKCLPNSRFSIPDYSGEGLVCPTVGFLRVLMADPLCPL